MANASNFLRTQIGTEFLNLGSGTLPSTLYIGLFTVAEDATGTAGTEVSGGGYARKQIAASQFADNGTGTFTLSNAQEFVTATGSWGTVVGMGIFDAATSGNLLFFDTITQSKTIATGDAFRFNASSIVVTIS